MLNRLQPLLSAAQSWLQGPVGSFIYLLLTVSGLAFSVWALYMAIRADQASREMSGQLHDIDDAAKAIRKSIDEVNRDLPDVQNFQQIALSAFETVRQVSGFLPGAATAPKLETETAPSTAVEPVSDELLGAELVGHLRAMAEKGVDSLTFGELVRQFPAPKYLVDQLRRVLTTLNGSSVDLSDTDPGYNTKVWLCCDEQDPDSRS